jgi:hypothetical protein
MTVDIRAKVICDLGEVISGGWSDDHVQGSGIIRTRGQLVLKGLVSVKYGQRVQLAYIKDGFAIRFPRSLRVLSSFPDPFRRQTTLQLGCRFTLQEEASASAETDLTAQTANVWDDPINAEVSCALYKVLSLSTSADFIATRIAALAGIPFSGSTGLTNNYNTDTFYFGDNYIKILSDLFLSENKVAYLTASEGIRIVDLTAGTGTHTVINTEEIIDVSSVNSGKIPAETVETEYTERQFKSPPEEPDTDFDLDLQRRVSWEQEETVGPSEVITIEYEGGTYRKSHVPRTTVITKYDRFDRVIERVETSTTVVASANPSYVRWYLENSQDGQLNDGTLLSITRTVFEYARAADGLLEPVDPDTVPPGQCSIVYDPQVNLNFDPERDTQVLRQITTTTESEMAVAGALNIPQYSGRIGVTIEDEEEGEQGGSAWSYQPSLDPSIITEIATITYEQDEDSGITKTTTVRQQVSAFTQAGQQVAAAEAEKAVLDGTVANLVGRSLSLRNLGAQVQTVTDRQYGLQRRPSLSQRKNEQNIKRVFLTGTTTDFSFRDEQGNTVEKYKLPYAPDPKITIDENGRTVYERSDAQVKARTFGEIQNSLHFGHRNGFSVVLSAQDIPTYPLDRFTITASGYSASFQANGISWSFDSNGIVCNVDALFRGGIGAIDTAGQLWFPVAPGITLLGPAPSVYQNPYPQPANSLPVDETFDPLNPPPTFWDEDLPVDTPAVPEFETDVDILVPFAQLTKRQVFVSRTVVEAERGVVSIPQETDVLLRVRTRVFVFELSARNVVIPTRTKLAVERLPVAIREDPVECLCAMTFDVFRSDILG